MFADKLEQVIQLHVPFRYSDRIVLFWTFVCQPVLSLKFIYTIQILRYIHFVQMYVNVTLNFSPIYSDLE